MTRKHLIYETDTPTVPGMYLGFFHGFKTEEERSNTSDWGKQGPLLGPLEYMHTTYGSHIKIKFAAGARSTHGINDEDMLTIESDGCVVIKGMRYGDWTVFPT
jgi:hypothetical protein